MVNYPDPNASREEIERYMQGAKDARERARSRRRSEANMHANSTCSSCGEQGHRRGVAACPNYNTPWRWQSKGERYVEIEGAR